MAAVPAQSLRVADIKDPAELFERYGADEIRLVERKVREQIEQKKEELRYMVGERYRDLIEAADTIGEMRGCSEKVVQSIRDMQNYCSKLKETKNTALLNTAQVRTNTTLSLCIRLLLLCYYYNYYYCYYAVIIIMYHISITFMCKIAALREYASRLY